MTNQTVTELIGRSNRLGADPKNTNYAGGNTSAKGTATDPVTGTEIELLWVKGSGGDLGTLTEQGLAVLRLDRLQRLVDSYPGVEREDEMVAAFDFCLHGKGGAAPSIDTAMHGLVDAAHVDHLHPDSGIAIATAVDGEALTSTIFGDRVVWVPWRRPGFQLGLDIAAIKRDQSGGDRLHPGRARDHRLGRDLRGGRSPVGGDHRHRRPSHRRAQPPRAVRPAVGRLRPAARRRAAGQGRRPGADAAVLASHDRPMVGHFSDDPAVLDFLAATEHPRLAALGTSCPDHFLRTKVKPLVLDLPAGAPVEDSISRLRELHEPIATTTRPTTSATPRPTRPAIRGADPLIILVPGVGMFCYGKDKQTARVAGEFYVNAINVMRGAEGGVQLRADRRGGEVPDRVLGVGGGEAARGCRSRSRWPPGSRWSPGLHPASARPSPRGWPPRAPAWSSPTSTPTRRPPRRGDRRHRRRDRRRRRRHRRRPRCRPRSTPRCWRSAGSTWWSTTPVCRSPSRCWRPPRPTGICSTT